MLKNNNNSYAKLVRLIEGIELPKGNLSISPWGDPFSEWSEDMRNYCAYDVVFGLKIYTYLESIISKKILDRYHKICGSWEHIIPALLEVNSGDLRFI